MVAKGCQNDNLLFAFQGFNIGKGFTGKLSWNDIVYYNLACYSGYLVMQILTHINI